VDRGDDAGRPVEVRLLGLPLRLLLAAQEHHDAVLRELQLVEVSATELNVPLPADLERLVDGLGVRHGFARARRDREVLEAHEKGLIQIDQTFTTHAAGVGRLREVAGLLNLADNCSEHGLLLTLPRPRLVREFSRWYLDQLLSQVEGRPPTPWSGPLTPGPTAP
jgi:hypothetical protein